MILFQTRYQRDATYLVWNIIPGLEHVTTQEESDPIVNQQAIHLEKEEEESDPIVNQQAIHLEKEEEESRVGVIYVGTDVFALLVNLFSREQIQSSMTMESHIHGRSCIDIKETARQKDAIIPTSLPLHGCDSGAATY